MTECKHKSIIGDNYGDSCGDCGKQLTGYGYGGWFGSLLTTNECIHVWSPMGESGIEACLYCETLKPVELK